MGMMGSAMNADISFHCHAPCPDCARIEIVGVSADVGAKECARDERVHGGHGCVQALVLALQLVRPGREAAHARNT